MRYKVGEIASMLGASISALRFFEERGLICPSRDDRSGYRMYDPIDLNRFLRIKTYTQCGFTLEETAQILESSEIQEVAERYREKMDELEKDIIWKQKRLSFMRRWADELTFCERMKEGWMLRERPGMYCLLFRTAEQISNERARHERIRQWTLLKPFSESLHMISERVFAGEKSENLYGMLIEERYVTDINIARDEYVMYHPRREACAFAVFHGNTASGGEPLEIWLRNVARLLKAAGYVPDGDVIGRVLHTGSQPNDRLDYVTEYWIPVEKVACEA